LSNVTVVLLKRGDMETGRVHWKVKAGTGCTEDCQQNTRALGWSQLSNTLISDFWYESCERTSFCLLFLKKKKKKGQKKRATLRNNKNSQTVPEDFFFSLKKPSEIWPTNVRLSIQMRKEQEGPALNFIEDTELLPILR
jgi:hypothetical protein